MKTHIVFPLNCLPQAIFVCEPSYLVGEVLTCVCPNPRLVLTAGTSSVVCVWVYHKVSAVTFNSAVGI